MSQMIRRMSQKELDTLIAGAAKAAEQHAAAGNLEMAKVDLRIRTAAQAEVARRHAR